MPCWVFAYGSNMDEVHLREWFKKKQLGWNILRSVRAKLPGYRLVWNYRRTSVDRGTGASNVSDDNPGSVLWGVALEVPDLDAMDSKEGFQKNNVQGSNYVRTNCSIEIDGFEKPVTATIYYAQYPESGFVSPLQKYKTYLLNGARAFDLPKEHIEEIERVKSREEEIGVHAFQRWLGRDCRHGDDLQDWFVSEAQLKIPR